MSVMSVGDSVTLCLHDLQAGNQRAAQGIWDRYRPRLLGLARKKLSGHKKRVADEEDIVQSALASFFDGVACGRFPDLSDRDSLWHLLAVITRRKVIDRIQHDRRRRRGGGAVRGESAIAGREADTIATGWDRFAIDAQSPSSLAAFRETLDRMLIRLGDESLRRIALWKMEGHTNEEIAEMAPCSRASVARKLALIRRIWQAGEPR